MTFREIAAHTDHTLLKQTAVWSDIKAVCDEAIEYGAASVCIPPSFVKEARDYVGDRMRICTVIGFPNGYSTSAAKCFETEDAVYSGADEIDMVINIGWVKAGKLDEVRGEISAVRSFCADKVLKVIVETCLLTDDEKTAVCRAVKDAGADYIKTSTGFSAGGATFEDVRLFSGICGKELRIKASGGISTLEDAVRFIELGADRLGASRVIALIKDGYERGEYHV